MDEARHIAYDPVHTRVEIRRDGAATGFVEFGLRADAAVLVHTAVDAVDAPALIDGALALLRDRGYRIVPLCPRVRAHLLAHPDRQVGVDTRFLDAARPLIAG
jgi:predicted GNAT family acetyltransferase